jgi:hypothetical protein
MRVNQIIEAKQWEKQQDEKDAVQAFSFLEFCKHHNVTEEEFQKLNTLLLSIRFNDRMKYLYTELLNLIKQVESIKEPLDKIVGELLNPQTND